MATYLYVWYEIAGCAALRLTHGAYAMRCTVTSAGLQPTKGYIGFVSVKLTYLVYIDICRAMGQRRLIKIKKQFMLTGGVFRVSPNLCWSVS